MHTLLAIKLNLARVHVLIFHDQQLAIILMEALSLSTFFVLLVITFSSFLCSAKPQNHQNFLQCLSLNSENHSSISTIVYYTPNNSSYLSLLNSRIWNLRFESPSTPKPLVIVTPSRESQIPTIISCSKQNGLQIRTRSGGHDNEGLSYTSRDPFIIIDLIEMSEITIDVREKTAWVQAGATIGELYYEISRKSPNLGFPAGVIHTVGVGGHFSGGGYGSLFRKYGLAADNIIDARIIDVNGEILDRKSMGEDLFWAVRGGGGASFGVITAWKVSLVRVPETVSVFSVTRTLEQNATQILNQWQYVAPNLPKELFIGVTIRRGNSTISLTFFSLFLGRADELLAILRQRFPLLGLRREDCHETNWIRSVLFIAGFPIDAPPRVLASRVSLTRVMNFKGKSDFVQKPIPFYAIQGIWDLLLEREADMGQLILIPFGGKMDEISESEIPFPHRAGNLYIIEYQIYWEEPGDEASERYINWVRRLYSYMTPYASKFPRTAYINYRDLDLGVNDEEGNTSYAQASVWGFKYFKKNFDRLVRVKSEADPSNFFRNEQSFPVI